MHGLQYLAEVGNHHLFAEAVLGAAKITLEERDDHNQNTRVYKGTRRVLDPEWKSMTFDHALLVKMPKGYVEGEVQRYIIDPLFQPVLDLAWEDYLWPEPVTKKFFAGIMTDAEFREAYGFPPKDVNNDGTTGVST